MRASSFCGIILAAGASSRMGRDKALLPWPPGASAAGDTFLAAAIRSLQQHTDMVIVVAGENFSLLEPVVYQCGASITRNPHPERGQFSSLQIGLQKVLGYGRDAAVVTLVDRPPVQPETVGRLRSEFLHAPTSAWAVIAQHLGVHGHPIVIGREMIHELLTAPQDSNAREVFHSNETRLRYCEVDDPSVAMNVNTPVDYGALCNSQSTHTWREDLTPIVATNETTAFIETVLAQRPTIAAFDCDGTLWAGDSGADFFYWEIERGLLSPEVVSWIMSRYNGYKAGNVDELTMCGEMVTIHNGLSEAELREAAREFFADVVAPRVFPEMIELTRRLAEQGCEIWAVSSTNNWVVEEGVKLFGIPAHQVLGAEVALSETQHATDHLVRVPTDELKASAIQEVIGRPVDAVFGNSIHDLAMLEIARTPYAINPNPNLEEIARMRKWTVYWPEATRK